MYHMHAPLDPDCPSVVRQNESFDDPIMQMSGCAGEFWDAFEMKHRTTCTRCQEYGAANIEVV